MNELFEAIGVSDQEGAGAMFLAGLAFLSTIIGLAAKSEDAKKSPRLTKYLDWVQMVGKVVGAFAALFAAAILLDAVMWGLVTIILTAVIGLIILGIAWVVSKNDPNRIE